jgi:hypothetical protein
MANKDALLAYKNAEVAKVFPLYGTEPFKGEGMLQQLHIGVHTATLRIALPKD